jgi:hypothetical protein
LSHTQFVQDAAILFVQAATPITPLTVTPSQYTIPTFGTHNVLNCTCRRFIVNDDKFNARLSNISLSSIVDTTDNAHLFAITFFTS